MVRVAHTLSSFQPTLALHHRRRLLFRDHNPEDLKINVKLLNLRVAEYPLKYHLMYRPGNDLRRK